MIPTQYLGYYTQICLNYRDIMLCAARSILIGKFAGYAEDAVQDALISIAKNIAAVSEIPPDKLKAFLIRSAKNKAIDIYRYESKNPKVDLSDIENFVFSVTPTPMEAIIIQESTHNLIKCIHSLGERYQSIMKLRLLNGLSEKEIASILGISEKTVNMRVYRGRKKLQEILSK